MRDYIWTKYNKYKSLRFINWIRLYEVVFYTFFTTYSSNHSSGLTVALIFNQSFGIYTLANSSQTIINYFFLHDLRELTSISSLELWVGQGAQFARSAGSEVLISNKYYKYYYRLILPSWLPTLINYNCRCLIGLHYNCLHDIENYGNAGTKIRLKYKVHVRGLAMNAGLHPHGGNSGPGKSLRSPWGWVTN